MKICFLAPANSAHILKWCRYFTSHGHEVHVISFTPGEISDTTVHYIDSGARANSSEIKKLGYYFSAGSVRKIIKKINPDIVSAHYASSYGIVAALTGLKNYFLSVWGSDIFEFPNRSIIHKEILKFSLRKAPRLLSTSKAMAQEAAKYTKKHFDLTPFGVDTDLFSPSKRNRTDTDFVIGTVKGLSYIYGIDYLIKAAAIVHIEHPEIPLKIRIAGKGPDQTALRELAEECGIDSLVSWLGFIPQEQAAEEWANMDIGVVYSSGEESFGVSALEAQACGCPLIISDAQGLLEASNPGETSLVVPRKKEHELAKAIFDLYKDKEKREIMGKKAVEFVRETYEYNKCFENIESIFEYKIEELNR